MFPMAFNYKQWSDQRMLDAVKKVDSVKFASTFAFASQQLNHMIIVEEIFKSHLLGSNNPHSCTNTQIVPELSELEIRLIHSNDWYMDYVAQKWNDGWEQEWVDFQFTDGKFGRMTRQEILFHIINHGTYHRGAIGHALDLVQANRPADTYTLYVHAVQPERREYKA